MKSLSGLLLAALSLFAQDTSGTGSLLVRVAGAPGVTVCLVSGSCEPLGPEGFVRFLALRPGKYQLEVQQQRTTIEVRAGLETDVELTLAELRPQQQTIEVTTSRLAAPEEIRTSVHLVEGSDVRTSAAAIKDLSHRWLSGCLQQSPLFRSPTHPARRQP
jgi:hypothetical protein